MPAERTSSRNARDGQHRDYSDYRSKPVGNWSDKEVNKRIYVGNMPYTAQYRDVEKLFIHERIPISNIDISIDPFTSRNPSYCFVDLTTAEDAELAMEILPGKLLGRRPLKVKPGVPKRKSRSTDRSERLESRRWNSGQIDRSDYYGRAIHSSAPRYLSAIEEGRRLYVAGLPKPRDNHSSDLEIRDIFGDFEVESVSKVKSRLSTEAGWYAFVDLASPAQAKQAILDIDKIDVDNGTLRVAYANGTPDKILQTLEREEQEMRSGNGSEEEQLNYG